MSNPTCPGFKIDLHSALGACKLCGLPKTGHVTLSPGGSDKAETVAFVGEFVVDYKNLFRKGEIADVTKIGTRYRCCIGDRESSFSFATPAEAAKVLKLEEKKKMEVPRRPSVVPPPPKPAPPPPPPVIKISPWFEEFKKARDFWNRKCLENSNQRSSTVSRARKYRVKGDSKAYTEDQMASKLAKKEIDRKCEIQLVDSKKLWEFAPISAYFPTERQEFKFAPSRPRPASKKPLDGGRTSNDWVYVDIKGKECGPVESREMTKLLDDGTFIADTKVKRVSDKDFGSMKKVVDMPASFNRGTDPEWLLRGRGYSTKEEVPCLVCLFLNLPERILCCLCREPVFKVEKPAPPKYAAAVTTSRPTIFSPAKPLMFTKFDLKEKDLVVPGPGWIFGKHKPSEQGSVLMVFPQTGECRVAWGKMGNSTKHSYANGEVIPAPPLKAFVLSSSSSSASRSLSSSSAKSTQHKVMAGQGVVPRIVTRMVILDVATTPLNASKRNTLVLGMLKERAPLLLKDVKKLLLNQSRSTASSLLDREVKVCRRWIDFCKEDEDSSAALEGFEGLIRRYNDVLANLSNKFRVDEMISSSEEHRISKPRAST